MSKSERMVEKAVAAEKQLDIAEAEVSRFVSPRGKLKLPKGMLTPLLDERRVKYYLPDSAFDVYPTYDTIFVWQLGRHDAGTFDKGGSIIMPDTVKSQSRLESSRGLLVSAGLLALDQLRSNGIDLGHVVHLVRFAPYNLVFDTVAARVMSFLVLHAGDVKGSEDVAAGIKAGVLKIAKTDNGQHYFERSGMPQMPWQPEE